MVNETLSSKYKILHILRNSRNIVSGDVLASETGISRTAVWKNIQALNAAGYNIATFRTGYILQQDLTDSLCPWEFGKDENSFIHFNSIDSTMNHARKIAEEEKSGPTFITADSQTMGKGRGDHKWSNAKGALAFTQITRDRINAVQEYRIIGASLCAAAKVLEEISGRKFYIRWPNDIWSSEGKVAGILDEYSAAGSICRWINLGVGINFTHKPKVKNSDCVFIQDKGVSRSQFLSLYKKEFENTRNMALANDSELEKLFNSLCRDYKKKIHLDNGQEETFMGISPYGWGKFLDSSGKEKSYPPGMIKIIKL